MGTERSSSNSTMTVLYFRSADRVHDYAQGPLHREAWNWWNKEIVKKYNHLSIYHELFHVPAGHWESIYVNNPAIGLARTRHAVRSPELEEKEVRWMSPVVDASRGVLKTSAGRMTKTMGTEHDGWVTDPYAEMMKGMEKQ